MLICNGVFQCSADSRRKPAACSSVIWQDAALVLERPNKELPMSVTDMNREASAEAPKLRGLDIKLEIVVIPVSDVDRAKAFYANLGWRLDADFASGDDWRVIQFTPPGSACSVIFGSNVTAAAPGSAQGLYLVVSDLMAVRSDLIARGVVVSHPFHDADGVYAGADEPYLFGRVRLGGVDPEHRSYRSFAAFDDPDGNRWLMQEVTARLPGRVDAVVTTFGSQAELAAALRRAAAAHGEYEKRTGAHDDNWANWYADYMAGEQDGRPLP